MTTDGDPGHLLCWSVACWGFRLCSILYSCRGCPHASGGTGIATRRQARCDAQNADLVGVCGAVVAPWTLRNYRIFGAIVPIRSNFGLELWIGNNPSANGKTFSSAWDDPKAPMSQPHPYTSPEEAERLTQAGEVQYMRDKLELASAWISRHPDRFINLTLHRIRLFWFPSSDLWSPSSPGRVLKSLAFSITAAAAWGNLIRLMLMRNPYRWLWLSALIGPSLSYAITHVDPRYRYPIFGLTILLACDFAVSGVRMYRGLPT